MLRDLISAFELIRKLKVDPAPRPTFRNASTACAFSTRSVPRLFTVISKFVACQAARGSSCPCALFKPAMMRMRAKSKTLDLIISLPARPVLGQAPFRRSVHGCRADSRAAVPCAQAAAYSDHQTVLVVAPRELP